MASEQWHLSKSAPISFIGAILGQTIALVWFVASLNNGIENNAREIVRHDTRIESLEASVQSQAVSMARMSENIQAIRDIVERMARDQ
jgi:type VI protein secretion system component VasK